MIRDLLNGAPAHPQQAEVCIIGAGAAGIVLAVELLRQGRSVLLLEGGGGEVEPASQEPYRSELAGQPHNGIHIGRFRAKGGTTTRWGGQILELADRDFQKRDKIKGSGWPIPKSELSPFYARAIALEGLSAAISQDQDVWRHLKLPPPSFESFDVELSRWCPEPDFARLHAGTLENHPNLTLWLHANAVTVNWQGARFTSIACKTLTGIEATFSAAQFVFCLGGIESSRFFLQPYAAAGSWHQSGLLGRYFQDHIVASAATIEVTNPAALHQAFDNIFSNGLKYQPKLHLKSDLQQAAGTLNVAASVAFNSPSDDALGQLKATARHLIHRQWGQVSPADLFHAVQYSPLLVHQALRYKIHQRAYNPPDAAVGLLLHCEQEPESQSTITLSQSRDSLGMFRTRLDWQVSDLELHSMRTLVEHAVESLAGIGRVSPDPALMALDPAFKDKCGDNYHHMGGMRMAASPRDGLVDLDLRLHGMENGYVCSSAVFPTSGYSNPTHTLLALAIRLADHLHSAS